jgi:hypothetical protein
MIPIEGLSKGDDGTRFAMPKDTARSLVCKHLYGEVPISDLYTEKVFTQDVLHQLDENIIKKTFQLPNIESLEDLADLTSELTGDDIDNYELGEINVDNDTPDNIDLEPSKDFDDL